MGGVKGGGHYHSFKMCFSCVLKIEDAFFFIEGTTLFIYQEY